jgi:hypothetical protein
MAGAETDRPLTGGQGGYPPNVSAPQKPYLPADSLAIALELCAEREETADLMQDRRS